MTFDTVIIGGGAAGLSAGLLLGRARRRVVIIDDNRPRNAVVERMHGFLTREGINPREFIAIARDQLRRYPSVEQCSARAVSARSSAGHFTVTTDAGEVCESRTVLLATGLYDELPQIDGLRDLWGRKAFTCPYCDGWEFADRRIAVVGDGHRAVGLAQELRQWSRDLLICAGDSNDLPNDDRKWVSATGSRLRRGSIASVRGLNGRVDIRFDDGTAESSDALFLAAPLRQRYPLVDMLGVRVRTDGEIEADSRGRTNVKGCYAAGDAVTTVHQVTLAAASGICAGMAINEDLTALEVRDTLRSA